MKTPKSTFKPFGLPADPRYPDASALYSTPPAGGEVFPALAILVPRSTIDTYRDIVCASDHYLVAHRVDADKAEQIVRACNSHADLLDVARRFIAGCQQGESVGEAFFSKLYDDATRALNK